MCEPKITRTVDVTNPAGIHARAATLIAELVRRFDSRVVVIKGCEQVDARDVLQILSLGTGHGEQLRFEAVGGDAEAAVDALVKLVADDFGESEQTEQAESPR
jgi:phosphotransferase system HPr (HPr) family protein